MPDLPKTHVNNTAAPRHDTAYQDGRARQARRQYPTNSSKWRRIRAYQLNIKPLCIACALEGKVTAAKVVDHVDGNSWNNSDENLASMCESCHNRKTAKQDGGFGRS